MSKSLKSLKVSESYPRLVQVIEDQLYDGAGNLLDISLVGPQGITGAAGIQGFQGLIGNQGTQGLIGTVGPQGVQGSIGNTGLTGNIGPQGVQGSTGTLFALYYIGGQNSSGFKDVVEQYNNTNTTFTFTKELGAGNFRIINFNKLIHFYTWCSFYDDSKTQLLAINGVQMYTCLEGLTSDMLFSNGGWIKIEEIVAK